MPEPTERDLETAQALLAVFDRQDESGAYVFSDADVRHFLPLMLFQLGGAIGTDDLDPATLELVGQLSEAAGVEDDTPPTEAIEKIKGFYERNPPNPTLVAAFQAFVREHLSEGAGGDVSKAVTQLLGREAPLRPLDGGGPRPAGSVGGGLLARLGADKALDAKKKPGDGEG